MTVEGQIKTILNATAANTAALAALTTALTAIANGQAAIMQAIAAIPAPAGSQPVDLTEITATMNGIKVSTDTINTVVADIQNQLEKDDSGSGTGGAPKPALPVLTSLSPANGVVAGGDSLTLTGTGFTGATGVTIGGVAVTSFNVASDTSVTVVTPALTAGSLPVIVTTPNGASDGTVTFTAA